MIQIFSGNMYRIKKVLFALAKKSSAFEWILLRYYYKVGGEKCNLWDSENILSLNIEFIADYIVMGVLHQCLTVVAMMYILVDTAP